VAEQLGVAVESVLGFIRRGDLKAVNVGRGSKNAWRIAKADLAAFLEARSNKREAVSQ
jgi:excisionase family DNA binding protein